MTLSSQQRQLESLWRAWKSDNTWRDGKKKKNQAVTNLNSNFHVKLNYLNKWDVVQSYYS